METFSLLSLVFFVYTLHRETYIQWKREKLRLMDKDTDKMTERLSQIHTLHIWKDTVKFVQASHCEKSCGHYFGDNWPFHDESDLR